MTRVIWYVTMKHFSQKGAFQLQAALPALPVYSSPQQQFYTPSSPSSSSRSKRRDLSSNSLTAPTKEPYT